MVRKIRHKVTIGLALIAVGAAAEAATPTIARRQAVHESVPLKTAKSVPASRLVKSKRTSNAPLPDSHPGVDASGSPRGRPSETSRQSVQKPVAVKSPVPRPIAISKHLAQAEELPPLERPSDDANSEQPPPTDINVEAPSPDSRYKSDSTDPLPPSSEVPEDEHHEGESVPDSPRGAEIGDRVPSNVVPPKEDLPAPAPRTQTQATPSGGIFRLDPPGKLIPVGADELIPGVIYLHDSPTLGRQVWSFVQSNGQFWHAFGPGTTQSVDHFDLRMTSEERKESLRKIDPKLAFDVSDTGAKVFFRLQADNTWKLVRTYSVPSIYDLETSQRWEKQWDRYLPVIHLCGDSWEHREGGYRAGPWASAGETMWDDGTMGGWDDGTTEEWHE